MGDISTRQNSDDNLQRLFAQSYLYSRAKLLSGTQATLAVATPALSFVAIKLCTDAQPWASLAGIVVALVNRIILDPWHDDRRKVAARIHEDFDCRVLNLPWNDALSGPQPAPEDIHEAAAKAKVATRAQFTNWYAPIVACLPEHKARVVCQRTNCWWDGKLRRHYRHIVLIVLGIVGFVAFLMSFWAEMGLQEFILSVATPLLPFLLWGVCEARRQNEAADSLDRLKTLAGRLWKEIQEGMTATAATRRSRELQDALYLNRRTNPFVFNWIYRKLRRGYEEQMQAGAKDMVDEANNASSTL